MKRGLERMSSALRHQQRPWILGYSGGKDSSAVLCLLLRAISTEGSPKFPINIVYCDTGVEIPPARLLAKRVMRAVGKGCLNVKCSVAMPALNDRFFVKVIGRGYAPPTNRFRWCTDKIRIRPVEKLVASFGLLEYDLILGARFGESVARDRVLENKRMQKSAYFRSANKLATHNFLPIFDYSVNEVWETIIENESFLGVSASKLIGLYREASGECPLIADPVAPPCGSARFGCWSCTVVSRDKSTESLVEHGYRSLQPLNDFRNWLVVVRSRKHWRWPVRRNGAEGLGPFTVGARRQILSRLWRAQTDCGFKLIDKDEVAQIRILWSEDRSREASLFKA